MSDNKASSTIIISVRQGAPAVDGLLDASPSVTTLPANLTWADVDAVFTKLIGPRPTIRDVHGRTWNPATLSWDFQK